MSSPPPINLPAIKTRGHRAATSELVQIVLNGITVLPLVQLHSSRNNFKFFQWKQQQERSPKQKRAPSHTLKARMSHLDNCEVVSQILLQGSLGLLTEWAVPARIRSHHSQIFDHNPCTTGVITTGAVDVPYDLEKITTFSLLTSPSTKDLGSDPDMPPCPDAVAVSVLLDPNKPMKYNVKETVRSSNPAFKGYRF